MCFAFKKLALIENDIINFIHKKKYHSNYVLQEMVKGYDVRDEKDEQEKIKILKIIQNRNKKKEKSNEKHDLYYGTGENYENIEENKNDYEKDFELNKTLINEIRMEINDFNGKVNNRETLFYIIIIILSLFHFYYVTVFTMTYYNCTKKLIISFLISFLINFIYPFFNCLIVVCLRYFSLNNGFIKLLFYF